MGLLTSAREFVNRYRFGFGTVAVTATMLSCGTIDQSLRFDVSPVGVVRYYTRASPYDGDIVPALNALTEKDVVELLDRKTVKNPGGLVYLNDGKLRFYRIGDEDASSLADQRLKLQTFPEMLSSFLSGNDATFNEVYNAAPVRSFLTRLGASVANIDRIVGLDRGDSEGRGQAREVLTALAPYIGDDFEMTLADKLRFYEHTDPAGEYVGRWEALGFGERADMQSGFEQATLARYIVFERQQHDVIVHAFSEETREEKTIRLGEKLNS